MSISDGGEQPSDRGLVVLIGVCVAAALGTAALTSWAWVYVSPQDPDFPAHEPDSRQHHSYWPGGAGCDPKRLDALPAKKAPSERERCAIAAQDEYENQATFKQADRANDLAEKGLRISAQQARAAFVQTIATVLAFGAAALAAVFAGFAAWHAKRSADADNAALRETVTASRAAREDAIEQSKRFTDQLNIASDTAMAMRNAALQASAANQIAIDTAAKQLRPYLIAETAWISWYPHNVPSFTVRFSNTGNTPVVHLMVGGYIEIDGISEWATHELKRADVTLGDWGPVGAKSHQDAVVAIPRAPEDIRSKITKETPLGLIGYAKYYDVFGEEYESEFAFFTLVPSPPENKMPLIPGRRPAFRQNKPSKSET